LTGEAVIFQTNKEGLKIIGESEMTRNEAFLDKGSSSLLRFMGEASSRYPIEYFEKLKIPSEEMTVEFGKDYPAKISFSDAFMVLAPRVIDEEEEEEKTEKKEEKSENKKSDKHEGDDESGDGDEDSEEDSDDNEGE
jgi:hypothetical protein